MSEPETGFDYAAERAYYTNPVTTVRPYEWADRDMRTWVPNYPHVFAGKRILDLGAGECLLTILIAERHRPRQIVALELILHRLWGANSKKRELNSLDLICGDCYELPFSDASFDIVFGNGMLHHLPRLDVVAAEIRRVLRPGGLYIGREPNFRNPLVRWRVLGTAHRSKNEYALSAEEVVSAFGEHGLTADVRYFWRRAPFVRHPWLAVSIAIHAFRSY